MKDAGSALPQLPGFREANGAHCRVAQNESLEEFDFDRAL
jgi:hypothetical protein